MDKEEYKRQNEQRDKRRNAKLFYERASQERLEANRGWLARIGRWFEWWKVPSDRFAALIALFTAVLSYVAYCQLDAMKSTDHAIHDQAIIAKNQMLLTKLSRLPWIAPESDIKITKPLTFDKDTASIEIEISFKNGGNGVALGVNLSSGLYIAPLPIPSNQSMSGRLMGAVRKHIAGGSCTPDYVRMMAEFEGSL